MHFTVGSLVAIALAFIIIKFATRLAMKVLGVAILLLVGVYAMYHFGVGPFKQNPIAIEVLEEKYCSNSEEKIKCDCIVTPIKKDLMSRFTRAELEEMEDDRLSMGYAFKKSFDASKPQIMDCLKKQNAEGQLKEFTTDLIPIENEVVDALGKLKNKVQDKIETSVEDFKSKKEGIDGKY
ncbi:MAG: hypothetical protein H6607_11060 [Flavobacteriales bacterium]|nr:hypothetical protein [Flavobacteriales bacterium]